jgi:hypothetical protein
MRAHSFVLAAMLAPLLVTGCGGVTDPSKNQIERFNGTVPNDGQGPVHPFNVSKSGELAVKITSLSPSPQAVVGLVFGQPSGGVCGYITSNDFVGLNRDQFQFPIQKGSYCVQAYDSGNLTVSQNYTLQVSHP